MIQDLTEIYRFNPSDFIGIEWFWDWGVRLRYRILAVVASWMSTTEYELVPGLVFGQTTLLSKTTKTALKVTGLYHTLSASGSNVSLVATTIKTTSSWVASKIVKFGLTTIAVVVYGALTGGAPPVVRAVLSRVYSEFGTMTGRQIHPVFAWFWSATLMILTKPLFFTELSFQLSVLATLGLALSPRLSTDYQQQGMLAEFFREAFWQTAAASLFVVPLCVYILGDSPTSALLTNTLAAPFVQVLTSLAFLLAGFGAIHEALQVWQLNELYPVIAPLQSVCLRLYSLINQSFYSLLNQLETWSNELATVVSVWWLMSALGVLFVIRTAIHLQRVRYSLKLIQRWSGSTNDR